MSHVYYRPVYAVSMTPPAVPLTAIEVGYDPQAGTFWEVQLPVLAVVAKVVGEYERRDKGGSDAGTPYAPPSSRTLAREGYRAGYGHRQVDYGYLVDSDLGPEELDHFPDCAAVTVVPTASLPPCPELIDELREKAKAKAEWQAVRKAKDTKGAP